MNTAVRKVLNQVGSDKKKWNTDLLVDLVSKADPKLTAADLWLLCSHLKEMPDGEVPKKANDPFDIGRIFREVMSGNSDKEVLSGLCLSNILTEFAIEYLKTLKPKNILYPWGEDPLGFLHVSNSLPSLTKVLAITKSTNLAWQADLFNQLAKKTLHVRINPEWVVAAKIGAKPNPPNHPFSYALNKRSNEDVIDSINKIRQEWDVIISAVTVFEEVHMIAQSAKKLSPTGVGLFIVSPWFFSRTKEVNVFDVLGKCGLAIESALSIPIQYCPNNTGLDGLLITIKKGVQGKIFVGELQADINRQKQLIKNIETNKEAKDFALGMVVEKEDLRTYQGLKNSREYQVQLSRQGLPVVKLADLFQEVNAHKRNNDLGFTGRANALYLPSIGFSEVVTSTEQFSLKPQNYLQLVLKPELVIAEFLAGFLNSELGLQARRLLQSGNMIPKISISAVLKGIEIPLPELLVQSQVMKADAFTRDLKTDVENVRKQLWGRPSNVQRIRKTIENINKNETFEEWLKTLPFPLASILWNYQTAKHDPKEQFELLLKFFEALAEFHATILLSVARREASLWMEVRDYLVKEREQIEKSTFGTWVELLAFISKRLRELWNNSGTTKEKNEGAGRSRCETAFGSTRAEVIDAMLSKQLFAVLRSANQFRNDFGGHYGILGQETARTLLVQLHSYLSEVRSIFGQGWETYKLILPTDRSKWHGEYHEVLVQVLQGPNTPFLKEQRELREPLKQDTLYLHDRDRDIAIEMFPLLRISNPPRDAINACYFYNRKQPGGARYVSYHFDKQADMTFSDSEMNILYTELFGDGGPS
jgi:hypothetical protein